MRTTILGAGLTGAVALDALRRLDPSGQTHLLHPVMPDGNVVLSSPALPALSPLQHDEGQKKLSVLTSLRGTPQGWQAKLGEISATRAPYSWQDGRHYQSTVGYDAAEFYLAQVQDPWFIDRIVPMNATSSDLHQLARDHRETGTRMINTLPLSLWCVRDEEHYFATATLWATENPAVIPAQQIDDSIVLNGDLNGPGWLVSLAIAGQRTVIYAGDPPPFSDLRPVEVPYRTTCDCTRGLGVGHVGAWANFDATVTLFGAHKQALDFVEAELRRGQQE